ncbi:glutamate synthase [Nitratireductor mangrovi]|uniref:Chaperone NapD n=1 Tax=Nitratireductor mangrovi TaxID=2599600 RepID=A0A5B8KWD4_9HYPH|nr:chaperone NapD [Nitratireductor mangrovi]QDY99885.1 glutamate synthase [Nitratireductor mangrovi]
MPEKTGRYHVSSAVVSARQEVVAEVMTAIAALPNTEIAAHEAGRIVVVMEGRSTGELGDRLTAIALLDGVIAANMVFEHAEEVEAAIP